MKSVRWDVFYFSSLLSIEFPIPFFFLHTFIAINLSWDENPLSFFFLRILCVVKKDDAELMTITMFYNDVTSRAPRFAQIGCVYTFHWAWLWKGLSIRKPTEASWFKERFSNRPDAQMNVLVEFSRSTCQVGYVSSGRGRVALGGFQCVKPTKPCPLETYPLPTSIAS